MKNSYKSEALAAVHETALGLTEAGVMSKQTMRTFNEMCLSPVEEMTPEQILELRLRENASQAVFALHLNVTKGLVSQWERGKKHPQALLLTPISQCAVERRFTLVGANPTQQLSFQLVATKTDRGGNDMV